MSKKTEFKVGEYVVYPTQGVGQYVRTEEQVIGGEKIKLLVVVFENNNMTLRIPVDRVELSGLRHVVSTRKMNDALKVAKEKATLRRLVWSKKAAQYEDNINSGDLKKVAEVVRDLQRRTATDVMTFSARQLYFKALERMAQEFAIIHKIDLDKATEKIEDILEIPKEVDLNAVQDDDFEEDDE